MMTKKYEIWLADLNPQQGTEPGKTRPVLVVQTDLLNEFHPSTIVCPITTRVLPDATLLRIHIAVGEAGLREPSDVLMDQMRAIDNRRFVKKVGVLPHALRISVRESLRIVLDLDD